MTGKEMAKQVIDAFPKGIIHALYVRAKFGKGEQEIRDGNGISQKEAKRRWSQWLK
jgi:hypothetical protein